VEPRVPAVQVVAEFNRNRRNSDRGAGRDLSDLLIRLQNVPSGKGLPPRKSGLPFFSPFLSFRGGVNPSLFGRPQLLLLDSIVAFPPFPPFRSRSFWSLSFPPELSSARLTSSSTDTFARGLAAPGSSSLPSSIFLSPLLCFLSPR